MWTHNTTSKGRKSLLLHQRSLLQLMLLPLPLPLPLQLSLSLLLLLLLPPLLLLQLFATC